MGALDLMRRALTRVWFWFITDEGGWPTCVVLVMAIFATAWLLII